VTGSDAAGRAAHIGPEHRWAQAALDRATARAAEPGRALDRLLAEKLADARGAAHPPPPPAPPAAGPGVPDGGHIADPWAETEEPARWTTDRW